MPNPPDIAAIRERLRGWYLHPGADKLVVRLLDVDFPVVLAALDATNGRLTEADRFLEQALFAADRLLDGHSLSVMDRQRVEYIRREILEARAAAVLSPKEGGQDA